MSTCKNVATDGRLSCIANETTLYGDGKDTTRLPNHSGRPHSTHLQLHWEVKHGHRRIAVRNSACTAACRVHLIAASDLAVARGVEGQ